MSVIIQSISGIADGIVSIIDFLGKRMGEGLKVLGYMMDAITNIDQYFTWAPVHIASIMSSIVLIAVLYRILGWGD